VVLTPWGDADTLRQRRLPPGRSGDRDAARREQRERLFAAVVASCEEKGFDATSVEDLLRTSGVSRATFYEQFDDKLDCFRAAEDEIVAAAISTVADEFGGEGDAVRRPRAALEAFIRLIVAQPAAARMCIVESYAAGETGISPVRRAIDWIILLGRDAAEQMPDRAEMPAPPFASYSPEQRIIRGFAAAVAKKGYPATTIADIAAAASISQTTFYEHFEGKDDALTAALDSSGAQLLAAVMPAVRRAEDWRIALRICFEEMCGFLASEPAFASLRTVDIYGAGPAAIASRDEIGRQIVGALLEPALKAGVNATDLMIEASAGAIYGVMFEGVWRGKTADLPRLAPFLTYFALAPFVGAEEACEVAISRGRTG
jgi:AcrR family transcriptional regulator